MLAGCGSDSGSTTDGSSGFDELHDQGLTRYVGEFSPAGEPQMGEDGVKTFEFAVPFDLSAEPRGPLCLRGTEYAVDTREGSSDELVIFLQGGGACWEELCSAIDENFTMSALSFSADFVISVAFLGIPPATSTASLLAETERTTTAFPDRYKRFIAVGAAHTALLRETSEGGGEGLEIGSLENEVGGVTVLDWFTAMIDGSDVWVARVKESLE